MGATSHRSDMGKYEGVVDGSNKLKVVFHVAKLSITNTPTPSPIT